VRGAGKLEQPSLQDHLDRDRRAGPRTAGQHEARSGLAFREADPIEFRCGLKFDPAFWTSCDSALFYASFYIYGSGLLRNTFEHNGDAMNLPGGTSAEQWIGLSLGRARQAGNWRGLNLFRPEIFFWRGADDFHDIPGEFAIAPSDHAFLVEMGGSHHSSESERFVGGSGRPNP
jgi:hypothetical protein